MTQEILLIALKKSMIFLVVAFLAAAYFLPSIRDRIADSQGSQDAKSVATAFALEGLNGGPVRLSDYRGKVVLVNFWASFCPPCREEIPDFERVYRAYKDRGFAIIGIAVDDVSPSFIKEMGITYPLAVGVQTVAREYGIRGLPVSFLIDGEGRIVKKIVGMYSKRALENDLTSLLKKS